MPQAEIIPITSRRDALRGAVLLKLCRQLDADSIALRRDDAVTQPEYEADPSSSLPQATVDLLCERCNDAIVQIIAIPAITAAQIRAKAGALYNVLMQRVAVETGLTFDEQAEDHEKLAMSLANDLMAVPG